VEATTPLFRIVDTRRLRVRADVAESDADEVPAGALATITSTSGSTRCAGRVEAHAPAVDARTRTVPFRVSLEAACGELHEGAYVDVSIERRAAPGRKLWVVPRDAVVSIDDATLVFVAGNESNAFEPRLVRVSEYGGPVVYLEDGVREGERVVSKGALLLKGEFIRARLE
jgi:multidrug efflux pump subunit AcrA (membrane-fusion protein)